MNDLELTQWADGLGLRYVEQWHYLARIAKATPAQARRVLLAIMDRNREATHAAVLAGRDLEPATTPEALPYPTEGPHRVLAWSLARGPSVVIARVMLPGRPWGRFVRKIGQPGWWAVCYPTQRAAMSGSV